MTSSTQPEPGWVVEGADLSRPSIARMYDYLMGGDRHVEEDRDVAHAARNAAPMIRLTIWENRKLIKRVVRELVAGGVTQILDIGSGIPARASVHEVAHAVNPDVKVVYADIDPVAAARGRELLADLPHCGSFQGDLTKPQEILQHPDVISRLDLSQPVALFFFNVLHFLDRDEVTAALEVYRDALAPGSHLAISHGTSELDGRGQAIGKVYAGAYGHLDYRTKDQLALLFGDFGLLEPGIVLLPDWRPEPSPLSSRLGARGAPVNCYAGVAVKP
ncbi:SAM-dependent methyltransferase [Kineosporia mesophila]|uniref:SAM-dependent methyltransferase n=1 Tax=Kineosporia mesophila TaxID=566012 RepID=A0ABP7AA30_9ACTN|nr:SAM-dependent methyltransferase [Kineosporia mesophila]MCD5354702.1 SAM-dependent methyltransferase [Kineosporia mesophila]